VARLVEESSLGTVGARQLRDRADAVTVARIRARAYFDGCPADRSWWNANQRNPDELLRKARELAAVGEGAISSVLASVVSGLLPPAAQGRGTVIEPVPSSPSAAVQQQTPANWRSFEVFYHREIDSLIRILCERADLPLGLARKLTVQAMAKAFDDWEHLAGSGDPGEWVIGCALQLHKSRQLPAGDCSWAAAGNVPAGIDVTALSPLAPPAAAARVAGALAVAASEVPDTSGRPSTPYELPSPAPCRACGAGRPPGQGQARSWSYLPADDNATEIVVTKIYRTHYRSLVRLATLLVRDVATAEEVVQDSFIAMHGAWRRLRDSDKALSYLRQSVVNRSRSVLWHRVVVDRNAPKPAPDMPSAEQGALSLLERSAVISALRTLPTRQREALVLKYYADLSEAQIAATMGISQGAVKSHTARGMASLRSVLELET
jgi:RNA polymerase sigma-70 factor (sigma-E family)